MPEINHNLSEAFRSQLLESYDESIVQQLDDWRYADLPEQPGEQLPYVRINDGAGEKPVLYVPGFTEGVVAKAPFAAALAERGFDVILPGQNRKAILKDAASNKKDATYSQARNYMAVLEAEKLTSSGVNVITHSYGSLIFNRMVELAETAETECFDDATVVMLAPAGSNQHETLPRLGLRFFRELYWEGHAPADFPDSHGDMFRAASQTLLANVPRAVRETFDLAKNRITFAKILTHAGNIAVVSFAQDKLFPQDLAVAMMGREFDAADSHDWDLGWSVPISWREAEDGVLRPTTEGATHNDDQANPLRVAKAVAQILRVD